MGTTNHWLGCWRQEDHPACRLAEIHRLQVKVLALETQLQYERTGHLMAGHPPLNVGSWAGVPTFTGTPCGDVEPPKIATHSVALPTGNPHFTHHGEEPPSATP